MKRKIGEIFWDEKIKQWLVVREDASCDKCAYHETGIAGCGIRDKDITGECVPEERDGVGVIFVIATDEEIAGIENKIPDDTSMKQNIFLPEDDPYTYWRNLYAGMAMQTIIEIEIKHRGTPTNSFSSESAEAFNFADAMIAEMKKRDGAE